jgi:D-alanyl-D-alanine carboxypeptidase/D-alanyl-D-alanine-endopeptidase (penicillin-binding protein 4)
MMRLLLCLLIGLNAHGQKVPDALQRLLKEDFMQGVSFGLAVREVDADTCLYAFEETRRLTPASVMKTLTTATALELLGAAYRFSTLISYQGRVCNDTLFGDLYITGRGDPTIGSQYLSPQADFIDQWVDAVRTAGFRNITGAVLADERGQEQGVSPKWLIEDAGNYYGAGCYGLNVFDNAYTLYLETNEAGERPLLKYCLPQIPSLCFHNDLQTVIPDAEASSPLACITGLPLSNDRYLTGSVPCHRTDFPLNGDIPDPPLFLAGYFTEHLRAAGIEVDLPPACLRSPGDINPLPLPGTTLLRVASPPLSRIIRITNEYSHNLYADALLKALGDPSGSYDRGIRALTDCWRVRGLDVTPLVMYDGNGLAIADKLSAAFVVSLLVYMSHSDNAETYLNSLPLAGREGTVKNFLKGTHLEGAVRLKSGSMTAVRCYAGYVRYQGRRYALAVLVNNYTCPAATIVRALEQLILDLFPPANNTTLRQSRKA